MESRAWKGTGGAMASLVFVVALPASLARRRGGCEESRQPQSFESEEKWEMEGEAGVPGTEGKDRGLPQACFTQAASAMSKSLAS